ncbi:MAG: substrate-binding domain-containing protein [Pirellulales bacterium]|nr:substrate-binding domain-containing protein [Pirellulales bacterium]
MPARPKYTDVMTVIKRRIREGDYLLNKFPGERKIAEETGVSYMTARRAVTHLLDEKVLVRGPSGALDVHPAYARRAKPAQVVLLYPAYPSTYLTQLRGVVFDFAQRQGVGLRPAQFVHWDEAAVLEATEQARAAIVIPYGPEIPQRLLEPFRNNKVVILDGDFTSEGLPSIRLFRDECIERVFEHLYALGHRRVDCLNTQNRNLEIDRRIRAWRQWRERRGLGGTLWDDPAPVFTDPTEVACRLIRKLLDEKADVATAIVSTTCPAAMGAVRACWERGLAVGKDLSICAVNIEPPAEYYCPSITGLNTPELKDVLEQCFQWFFSRQGWRGPLLVEPRTSDLFMGESTAKPRRTAATA